MKWGYYHYVMNEEVEAQRNFLAQGHSGQVPELEFEPTAVWFPNP